MQIYIFFPSFQQFRFHVHQKQINLLFILIYLHLAHFIFLDELNETPTDTLKSKHKEITALEIT